MSTALTATPGLETSGPPRLRERFGALRLPWLSLGDFPTPVEHLPQLSRELQAGVWVKRDDRAGALYGGNKVRKLELLLADALARGKRTVVTLGAYGSHHALATALYARKVGLGCQLVLYPQPLTPHVLDDLLADQAAGARLIRASRPTVGLIAARARALAGGAYLIPGGGSSPLGALGFVEAGLELAAQVRQGLLPSPDLVFVAAGTCGTVAGLALGLELAGLATTRIVAVRVVPAILTNLVNVHRLARGALRILRRAGAQLPARQPVDVVIDPHELGPGYGRGTPAAQEAMERFARHGVQLETTYTGKAAAALLRWCARPGGPARTVLFWNTYNGVDIAPLVAQADPQALPPEFHPALREGGRLA